MTNQLLFSNKKYFKKHFIIFQGDKDNALSKLKYIKWKKIKRSIFNSIKIIIVEKY